MGSKPTITYFDIRGRAEPIRLTLEEVGVTYDDRQIGSDEWKALKPKTPFGGLPSYQDGDGGPEFYQGYAIYRHLARVHDLDGSSEAERIACDVACEAIRDAKDHLGQASWRPREERSVFVDEELPPRLAALTRLFETNSGPFWAGSSVSIADMLAFAYLEDLEALFPGALSKSEALTDFRARFAARPRIAAYLASRRRPPAIQYGPKGLVYPAD